MIANDATSSVQCAVSAGGREAVNGCGGPFEGTRYEDTGHGNGRRRKKNGKLKTERILVVRPLSSERGFIIERKRGTRNGYVLTSI